MFLVEEEIGVVRGEKEKHNQVSVCHLKYAVFGKN